MLTRSAVTLLERLTWMTVVHVVLLPGCMSFLLDAVDNTTCMTLDRMACKCTSLYSKLTIDCVSGHTTGHPGTLQSNNYFTQNSGAVYDDVNLSNNNIGTIDVHAFQGIEDDIYDLDLSGNKLYSLPSALTRLSRLSSLDLSKNPLIELQSGVMSTLGLSLKSIHISMGNFYSWPVEIGRLNKLEKLTVHDIQFGDIPSNAFDSFKYTINSLNITKSMIRKVPSAICNINYFQTLSFVDNVHLGANNTAVFEPCHGNRSRVKFMFIAGSKMEQLPVMHNTVASVDNIGIINTNLQFVNQENLMMDSSTRAVDLKENDLVRIPFALNKLFPMLRYLDVSKNSIRTVEELDIYQLTHLNSLILNNNPLRYIAKDAFKFNPNLSNLELSNTKLGHIPSAVMSLKSLYIFNINNSGVACDCGMKYLKPWNVNGVTFTDMCSKFSMSIKTYLTVVLPTC